MNLYQAQSTVLALLSYYKGLKRFFLYGSIQVISKLTKDKLSLP